MLEIFHFCKKYLSENVLFLYLYVVLCIFFQPLFFVVAYNNRKFYRYASFI